MSRRRKKRRIANGELPPGAVHAAISQQVAINTYGPPKTFYVDIGFKCRDCGIEEVWTAEQQEWFYEVAKGSLHATAIRCRECRLRLKQQKERQHQQMDASAREQQKD